MAYPVVCTTSKLMTTGVDAQTCQLIVLDRSIKSMTEFKQIIGRGTRINEDHGKLFFTIIDFRQASALFADPDFDGDPVQIYDPTPEQPILPPPDIVDEPPPDDPWGPEDDKPKKYFVGDVEVRVATERVQYLDASGKLITESLTDYSRKTVLGTYASLDAFLNAWKDADKKQAIIEELGLKGVFFEELAGQVGADYDPFDLICHVAFDQPPLTRKERAEKVKKRHVFARYGDKARAVLDALLAKYADDGIGSVGSMDILKVDPISQFGTPVEIVNVFGGREAYLKALHELEDALYSPAA